MRNSARLIAARELLLRLREDLTAAGREFQWPRFEEFNWALDYFDVIAQDNHNPALRVVSGGTAEESLTFAQLARRSSQVANFMAAQGVGPGDRILLMLANVVPLWETMLAAIKLGAVIIPATTLLERTELLDRLERGRVRVVVTTSRLADRFEGLGAATVRIAVGEPKAGWLSYDKSHSVPEYFEPATPTRADDLLLLYFTSGTTARPKLVAHTHASYPIGHLSTMYWLGLRPGDVHLNLSSPGWAKHAWSSLFAPWNAEACALSLNYERRLGYHCARRIRADGNHRPGRQSARTADKARVDGKAVTRLPDRARRPPGEARARGRDLRRPFAAAARIDARLR
jgi:acetyl-CoA synthetase